MANGTQEQTFSDVTPVAQTFESVTPIDTVSPEKPGFGKRFAAASGLESLYETGKNQPQSWGDLFTRALTDLPKQAIGAVSAPVKHLQDVIASHKAGDKESAISSFSKLLDSFIPSTGDAQQLAETTTKDVAAGNIPAVLGTATGLAAQAELTRRAIKGPAALTKPVRSVQEFVGRKLPAETISEAPTGGKFQPALANTPKEVVEYAANKGIDLTPAQATGTKAAQAIEGIGERSLIGGQGLEEARAANAQKLASNIREFADRVDPKAMGTSEEAAGENIQKAAQVAKDVSHENATAGYNNIDWLSTEKVATEPITNKWMALRERLPLGAEEQIINQVPRSMRAHVSEMLSPTGMEAPLTFDQGIALRSFFRELGETEGLPNSQQGIFRQMTSTIDNAMEKSAEAKGGLKEWRSANEGWKDYSSLYGDRQSPLYRILKQQDPAKITRDILNRSSAHDIDILNQEGMTSATEALKRQALTDIANRGFTVRGDGLGGYSHSFLNTLFGPEVTKELYLNGDLARRFKFQVNPSGTSNVLLAFDQLRPGEPSKMMVPMGAAKASMPRPAASYLPEGNIPKGPTPSSNLPGGPTSFTPKKPTSNFAYRVRNQGEEGLPIGGSKSSSAHATTTLEDAQQLAPGREAVTGEKQEVVRYDLSKLKEGKDYVRVKRAGQPDWIRMLRPLREADLQAAQ